MLAALASGYHGPPELTWPRAFTQWSVDPWALGFVLLLGGLYLAGVRRVRRSGQAWPADPVPKRYPYLVSLWVTGAEVVGDAILGLAVIADQSLIAGGYYHALARPWGPSLSTDQVLGGGALWILGDIVGLPFLAAQLIQMIREDEAEATVIDAELDARDAASVGSGGAQGAAGRPWWESDPRFVGRFRPLDDGQERE